MSDEIDSSCPVPQSQYERIVLAHGGGGRAMHRLIEHTFARILGGDTLRSDHDGAVLRFDGPVAMTTDTFTVHPLFFPGGDIGRLAVCGTVNDLAMCGAWPQHLAVAFTLEEGLLIEDLERILQSMADVARDAGVSFVTGDTKVVERGKGDGVFITTTGVGSVACSTTIGPSAVAAGDAIVVSGPVGDHGMAVMSVREGLEHETAVLSDVAPLAAPVLSLFDAGIDVHCLRDPTRGGLASALCEIASSSGRTLRIEEEQVPVRAAVADACELLGLDPLYVACEGRFVAFVPGGEADRALQTLVENGCPDAALVGRVDESGPGRVLLASPYGTERVLDMLSGEQLPRIC